MECTDAARRMADATRLLQRTKEKFFSNARYRISTNDNIFEVFLKY